MKYDREKANQALRSVVERYEEEVADAKETKHEMSMLEKIDANEYGFNDVAKFKEDLLREFSVKSHLRAERAYELAWQYGHANGLREVYYYFWNFVSR